MPFEASLHSWFCLFFSSLYFFSFLVLTSFYLLIVGIDIVQLYNTHWHATVSGTPLDEGMTSRKGLYLTAHNTYKRERERDIHASCGSRNRESSKRTAANLALDRAATRIGYLNSIPLAIKCSGRVNFMATSLHKARFVREWSNTTIIFFILIHGIDMHHTHHWLCLIKFWR